jgi:hypothetical protein
VAVPLNSSVQNTDAEKMNKDVNSAQKISDEIVKDD